MRPSPLPRLVTTAMRRLLVTSGVLAALAGLDLFLLSEETDRLFAWTIGVPLTAAFLGAGYLTSLPIVALAVREPVWARARVAILGVFAFTTLTALATALHLDAFHLEGTVPVGTRAFAWAWLAVYAIGPLAQVAVLVGQLHAPGGDPPREAPLPGALRLAMAAQAATMLGIGAILFAAPATAASVWPWELTPLTSRAIGAWLLGMGVVAAQAVWEDDAARLRSAMVAWTALGVLQLVAVLRFTDAVDWSALQGPAYVGFLVSLILVGGWGLWAGRRTPGQVFATRGA
jgi:hypothetical protein